MNFNKVGRFLGCLVVMFPLLSSANSEPLTVIKKQFGLELGNSRIIYKSNSNGTSLQIINPQKYPVLVQTKIFKEDKISPADFVVTPPLFRLDGQEKSRLRIISYQKTVNNARENLNWICVTGIPPTEQNTQDSHLNSSPSTLVMNMSIKNCIKLIERPATLRGHSEDAAALLSWKYHDGKVSVDNTSPYYINIRTVKLDNIEIGKLNYIPPFGRLDVKSAKSSPHKVEWDVMTDLGGVSKPFTFTF